VSEKAPKTRLEAFCRTLTKEIIDAWQAPTPTMYGPESGKEARAAARAVAERRVRSFVQGELAWATDGCADADAWVQGEGTVAFFTTHKGPSCSRCESLMIPHGSANRLKCVNCGATCDALEAGVESGGVVAPVVHAFMSRKEPLCEHDYSMFGGHESVVVTDSPLVNCPSCLEIRASSTRNESE
jgi:hypothetical protein